MKMVWVVFLAWFSAQLYKCLVQGYKSKWNWSVLVENGGMPSAHAAVVTALSAGIYVEEGFSFLFVACVVFALIVLNDALTVRWQTGVQAGLLSGLLSAKKRSKVHLSNSLGHTPSEILAGIVLGLLWVWIFYARV
ncbi:MAG: divergent PAP2 family protein [Nanoarchaeota archaeon]